MIMTDDEPMDLAEIGARAEAATPGPWTVSHRDCTRTEWDDDTGCLGLEVEGPPEARSRGQFERSADARFIAHSRVDVPALLALVERLQAELDGAVQR